jgi:hypothetical protein
MSSRITCCRPNAPRVSDARARQLESAVAITNAIAERSQRQLNTP